MEASHPVSHSFKDIDRKLSKERLQKVHTLGWVKQMRGAENRKSVTAQFQRVEASHPVCHSFKDIDRKLSKERLQKVRTQGGLDR